MIKDNIIKDHTILIEEVLRIIKVDEECYSCFNLGNSDLPENFDYKKESSKGDYVVLGEDTGLELGSPGTLSVSRLLWTNKKNLVKNCAYIIGNSLAEAEGRKISFLQIVMIEVDENIDPYKTELHRIKNLSNIIPGYMTRNLTDKIWIRIHKSLLKKNFTLQALAEVLHRTYLHENPGVKNADILLIADDDEKIESYLQVNEAARLISSENNKNRWIEDGVLTCEDFDCSSCDEQKDCNSIKEIITKRGKCLNE